MTLISSPILAQAGFLKRKAAPAVEQWVAKLDGATQCWLLSESINLIAGDKVRLTYKSALTASTSIETLYSNDADHYLLVCLDLASRGGYLVRAGSLKVDGNTYTYPSPAPTDGLLHTVEQTISRSVSTSLLGASWFNFASGTRRWYFNDAILDFEVERAGEIIHKIPLTNKDQGATQLATVGNVNAFMPNYTDAVWRKP
ncbi:MAG: hypothetical protein CML20_09345 [Rheinheimera sp.]|nr:hypothetical protein [Rheinheimera sp.]|tara:strand:+ start:751 stop:1350 length:600 start_codon:yes stop_codon:yes gene_type:complete